MILLFIKKNYFSNVLNNMIFRLFHSYLFLYFFFHYISNFTAMLSPKEDNLIFFLTFYVLLSTRTRVGRFPKMSRSSFWFLFIIGAATGVAKKNKSAYTPHCSLWFYIRVFRLLDRLPSPRLKSPICPKPHLPYKDMKLM